MAIWLSLHKILPRHRPLVGGKAANLARLTQAGFLIPPGFCITTSAYHRFLQSQGLEKEIEVILSQGKANDDFLRDLAEVRRAIEEAPLPLELEGEIRAALQQTFPSISSPISLALRSSASSEDSAIASFAGIHDTYLNITTGEDLGKYIKCCWASMWSERAHYYRARYQEKPLGASMGVIVQKMVKAEASGIAFSAHPFTGEHGVIVINASWGLGDAIASGKVHPDQYIIRVQPDWHGGLLLQEKLIAKKEVMSILIESKTQLAAVPPPKQHVQVLSDNQIFELGQIIREVAQDFGCPQDIEWTWDGECFQLLQSRPITGLPSRGHQPEQPILWSRANLKEILPETPCPLTISWVTRAISLMWQEHYGKIGYRLPTDAKIISVFHGRPYFNITFMQRIAAELGAHPSSLSGYIGGPAEWSPQWFKTPFIWKALLKKLPITLRITRLYRRLPKLASTLFTELMDRAMRDNDLKIGDMSDEEIGCYLEEFEAYFRQRDLTLAIVSAAISSYTLLEWIMRTWLGIKTKNLIGQLLTGLGNIESTQQTLRLMSLAKKAREEPKTIEFFLDPSYCPSKYREKLDGTEFLRDFTAYLKEFGHRGIYETDTMYPCFAEDPSYLLNVIHSYIEAESIPDPDDVHHQQKKIREEAFLKVKEELARQGFLRRRLRYTIFCRTYRDLCTAITLRERNRHYIMMTLHTIRKIHLELGKRFTERGIIQQPQDFFFLSVDEIRGILQGSPGVISLDILEALVEERKKERDANARLSVPDQIWGELSSARPQTPTIPGTKGEKTFQGIGLSPGVTTGLVRVFSHPGEKSLKAGEILVAPVIDPSWAPLFGLASGLIVELGGLLSHGSIVAREYGIPAVANISGITKALKDGILVTVDGDRGEVRIL